MSQDGSSTAISRGFPPVFGVNASVLILGSLPGRRSLAAGQYYAQPQNSFWRIMGALYGAGPELAYEARLNQLKANAVSLWDVLASGRRPGSLDSAIVKSTVVTNDFASFFEQNTSIRLICFNGAAAADLYRRRILPTLQEKFTQLSMQRLPSTSPAHARMPYGEKLRCWAKVLENVPALDGESGRLRKVNL